jgi:hypothetical protein
MRLRADNSNWKRIRSEIGIVQSYKFVSLESGQVTARALSKLRKEEMLKRMLKRIRISSQLVNKSALKYIDYLNPYQLFKRRALVYYLRERLF